MGSRKQNLASVGKDTKPFALIERSNHFSVHAIPVTPGHKLNLLRNKNPPLRKNPDGPEVGVSYFRMWPCRNPGYVVGLKVRQKGEPTDCGKIGAIFHPIGDVGGACDAETLCWIQAKHWFKWCVIDITDNIQGTRSQRSNDFISREFPSPDRLQENGDIGAGDYAHQVSRIRWK